VSSTGEIFVSDVPNEPGNTPRYPTVKNEQSSPASATTTETDAAEHSIQVFSGKGELLILFEMKRKRAMEAGATSMGTVSMATVRQIPSQVSPMM